MSIAPRTAILVTAAWVCLGCCLSDASAQQPQVIRTRGRRHVPLDGQPNFRDLGGYRTVDGRTVKWGQVYRSGELPRLTDRDLKALEQLQLRTVVNFLTAAEITAHGNDRLPTGVNPVAMPMEAGNLGELAGVILEARKTGDFSDVPPDLNPQIHRLLILEGKDYYAQFLRTISDETPLVFHCSHGIHRTGTAAAILLSALGVPWETIREDYLLSNELRKEEVERRIAQLTQLAASHFHIPVSEVDDQNIRAFYVLQGSYIDAARDAAVEEFGSMEAYIRDGLGLSDEEVDRLRDALLTP